MAFRHQRADNCEHARSVIKRLKDGVLVSDVEISNALDNLAHVARMLRDEQAAINRFFMNDDE